MKFGQEEILNKSNLGFERLKRKLRQRTGLRNENGGLRRRSRTRIMSVSAVHGGSFIAIG